MKTELVEITLNGWEKFNYRKDVKRASWFRLDHNIFEESDLHDLDSSEMCAFIYILCQASKKNTGNLRINLNHAQDYARISKAKFLTSLSKLESTGVITRNVQSRERENAGSTLHYTTRHNITEHRNTELTPVITDADYVPPELFNAWLETYKDQKWVELEISKARAWLIANPNRAPKKDFKRFFNSWMSTGWESYRKTLTAQTNKPKPITSPTGLPPEPKEFRTGKPLDPELKKLLNKALGRDNEPGR